PRVRTGLRGQPRDRLRQDRHRSPAAAGRALRNLLDPDPRRLPPRDRRLRPAGCAGRTPARTGHHRRQGPRHGRGPCRAGQTGSRRPGHRRELSRFDPGRPGHRTVNDETAKKTSQNTAEGVPNSVAAWEERYSGSEDTVWSGNPNEALVATVAEMTPGRVLDVGCGEGADAIWLAEHGWDVTGIDLSTTAIDRARTAAEARGVHPEFAVGDVSTWEPETASGSDEAR